MKPQDIIKAVAELDGRYVDGVTTDGQCYESIPQRGSPDDGIFVFNYLTSRDAIMPVIEKQSVAIQEDVLLHLVNIHNRMIMHGTRFTDFTEWRQQTIIQFQTTPSQLCEALLRATGKWVE